MPLKDYVRDLELEVVHHTQLLAELVDEWKLVPGRLEKKVTYHDPCYLGRHNVVYGSRGRCWSQAT